ncbi:MAG: DUF5996 family protein [Thermoleophilia bacterium]
MALDGDEGATATTPTRCAYFAAATEAALVLAAFRAPAPRRSRSEPPWWGSFDLAVNLFSGASAKPPSGDFHRATHRGLPEEIVGVVARR